LNLYRIVEPSLANLLILFFKIYRACSP